MVYRIDDEDNQFAENEENQDHVLEFEIDAQVHQGANLARGRQLRQYIIDTYFT